VALSVLDISSTPNDSDGIFWYFIDGKRVDGPNVYSANVGIWQRRHPDDDAHRLRRSVRGRDKQSAEVRISFTAY
jgi:hypothetical protein